MSSILSITRLNKFSWPVLGAIVGIGALLLVLAAEPPLTSDLQQIQGVWHGLAGPIIKDTMLRQVFKAQGNSLGGVGLVLSTVNLSPSDKVRVAVLELDDKSEGASGGRSIASAATRASEITSFALTVFRLEKQKIKPGAFYAIEVAVDSDNKAFIAATKKDVYADGALYIDGKEQQGDAAFRIYRAPSSLNPFEGIGGGNFKPLLVKDYLFPILLAYSALLGVIVAGSAFKVSEGEQVETMTGVAEDR